MAHIYKMIFSWSCNLEAVLKYEIFLFTIMEQMLTSIIYMKAFLVAITRETKSYLTIIQG